MILRVVAHVKKQMPFFLWIGSILWSIRIFWNYDATFTPITWSICVMLTAGLTYVIVTSIFGILDLMWLFLDWIIRKKV